MPQRERAAVQATNSLGPSDWSSTSTFVTQAGLPAQPQAPEVVGSTPHSLTLHWRSPADNGAPITDFQLESDDGQGLGYRRVFTGSALEHALHGLQVGLDAGMHAGVCRAADRSTCLHSCLSGMSCWKAALTCLFALPTWQQRVKPTDAPVHAE